MSEKQYAAAAGFIQFDPREREVNGKKVVDVTIRAFGSQKLVQITLWPEFQLPQTPKKGDFIAADGSFEAGTYQAGDGSTRESLQISPFSLAFAPGVAKAEREVVQAQGTTTQVVQASSQNAPF